MIKEAKMPRKIFKTFFCLTLGIALAGCSSVKARTYVETKERVDQEPAGNAGYLFGTPAYQPVNPPKKTRQVYVLELSQKTPEEGEPVRKNAPSLDNHAPALPEASSAPSVSSPVTEVLQEIAPPTPFVAPTLPAQYTIGKDDTLQTIAKKFYNSYGKWPKIYEANKDKIPDPNRIKPGLVLTIPAI